MDFYTCIKTITDPENITVLVDKFHRLDSGYIPRDLEVIDPSFNSGELLLRHEARLAFEIMCREAETEGMYLEAISAFRSFDYQDKVYYKNLTVDIPLEQYQAERDKVSARPGHSEHQTGLAVDINDLEETFSQTREAKWLVWNSFRFGFVLRYPKGKEHITGYQYEPWHFRYLGRELAAGVCLSGLTYDEYYRVYLSDTATQA